MTLESDLGSLSHETPRGPIRWYVVNTGVWTVFEKMWWTWLPDLSVTASAHVFPDIIPERQAP